MRVSGGAGEKEAKKHRFLWRIASALKRGNAAPGVMRTERRKGWFALLKVARVVRNGAFSPYVHLALVRRRSAWIGFCDLFTQATVVLYHF